MFQWKNSMSTTTHGTLPLLFSRRLAWAGYLLGFSLGGFFDGILLHQILQWHHLLTNVESPFFQDMENQILADGLFHVLMYFIAFAGLWKLWQARRDYAEPGADKPLLGNAFLGFGVWHILDSILSHWILGIHRIRGDAENVLFWDLLWFFVFGVAFVAIGLTIRRRASSGKAPAIRSSATALALALTVMAAGPIAALPPADTKSAIVFFKPGTPATEVFKAIEAANARILWSAGSGDVWALSMEDRSRNGVFYRHGAYLVSSSALAIGCLAWSVART
jgi:uncharacterized membrane protein